MPQTNPPEKDPAEPLPADLEAQVVQVFVDGVRVLGLPRSLGELYGLLYISPEPLALDDLVARLGISKGSASQGLRALKDLGAVKEIDVEGARRTYFEAHVDLKRLVGGFIREQVRPHLESGQLKSARLTNHIQGDIDPERRLFYVDRIEKLQNWIRRGRRILPVLQKLLGE